MAPSPTVAPRTLRVVVPALFGLGIATNLFSYAWLGGPLQSGEQGLGQVGLVVVWYLAGLVCVAPFRRAMGIETVAAIAAPVGALVWTALFLALHASDLTPSLTVLLPVHGLLVAAAFTALRKQGAWTRRDIAWPAGVGLSLVLLSAIASATTANPLALDSAAIDAAGVPWQLLGDRGAFPWALRSSARMFGADGLSGGSSALAAAGLVLLWVLSVRGLRLVGATLQRSRWLATGASLVLATSPGWSAGAVDVGADVVMGTYVLLFVAAGWFASAEDEPVWWLWCLVAGLGLTLMGTMTPVLVGLVGGVLLARAPLEMSQRVAWMAAYLILSGGWYGWWVAQADTIFSAEKTLLLIAVPGVVLGLFGSPGSVARRVREHLAQVVLVASVGAIVLGSTRTDGAHLVAAMEPWWGPAVCGGIVWVLAALNPIPFGREVRSSLLAWGALGGWLAVEGIFETGRAPWVQILPPLVWLAAMDGLGRTPALQSPPKPTEMLKV